MCWKFAQNATFMRGRVEKSKQKEQKNARLFLWFRIKVYFCGRENGK